MAISKKRKEELVAQYIDWLNRSQAMIVTDYVGLSMKDIDELRVKIREVGGEFHIIKNTLSRVAFDKAEMELPEEFLEGSTAIAFAFQDTPGMAKAINEFARESDFVKIKGGYLDRQPIGAADVKALAKLPPLPVIRAQLLGTLMAPANKLARVLSEPARQVAAVIKANAEQDSTPVTV